MMRKFLIAFICCLTAILPACAEENVCYIICQPDSYVNVRKTAKKDAEIIGRYEIGEKLTTDGRMKNGFLHLINLALEDSEGWVYAGYVSWFPVEKREYQAEILAKGRVACRRAANGNRRKWLKPGNEVTVYGTSADWSVTSQGFIRTEYLMEVE